MQSQSSPKVVLRGSCSSLLSSNIAAKCSNLRGLCGGASGKAIAFCPNGSGLNPWTDLALRFSLQICFQSILMGIEYFLIMQKTRKYTFPSSFLFPIIIAKIINCNLKNSQGKYSSKQRPGKAHFKKRESSNLKG